MSEALHRARQMAGGTVTPRRRAAVLSFVADAPDATLRQVARGCRQTRADASATLDALIRDGLMSVRHPGVVRLGVLLFGLGGLLAALFVGAERYSPTEKGYQALLGDASEEVNARQDEAGHRRAERPTPTTENPA